ncbi:MAG: STAS domain-containing protein [Hyphomicrobium sp.]
MLELKNKKIDTMTVLSPVGRIDSATAKSFEDGVMKFLDGSSNKIVMDLSSLEYVSSAGLRVFLTAAKKAKSLGGGLTLCAPKPNVREVFDISGFTNLFGVHASEKDACASFAK